MQNCGGGSRVEWREHMSRHTGLGPGPAPHSSEARNDAQSIRPLRRSECHRAGCATCPLCYWATGSPGQRRGWEQGTLAGLDRAAHPQLNIFLLGLSIPGYPGCVTPRCVIRLRASCWDILKAKANKDRDRAQPGMALGWGAQPNPGG